ncbi:MAG: sigma-70 family RNA polymerase sigma factor [Ignavibacterium sp.]
MATNPKKILHLNDDFTLIKNFIDGDESAFRILVNRHKDKVRNLIYLQLGNTDYVDDISQEVFISVYKKLHHFRFESQFTTWLYRITINKCYDHIRKTKVKNFFHSISEDEEDKIPFYEDPDNFDLKELIQDAISKLPEKLKTPLILRDYDGFSYQEISDIIGSEIGTVKSRIFRARESLKKILEPHLKDMK